MLTQDEEKRVIDIFNKKITQENFSIAVSYEEIAEKNYFFSASQYFKTKINYSDITPQEFSEKIQSYNDHLEALFTQSHGLELSIKERLQRLKYDA